LEYSKPKAEKHALASHCIMASVLNDSTYRKLITEPNSDTEETTPSLRSGCGADIVKKSLPHAAKYRSSTINKGGVILPRSTVNCIASPTYGLAE